MPNLADPDAGAPPPALRYGSLVNLYKQSLDGYVVATFAADTPIGVQSDTPEHPLRYEQTVFLLQHGDPVEAMVTGRTGDSVVKYGQTVRLLHYTHQQYLSYDTERHAASMKGNQRVVLDRHQRNTKVVERWRIMPRYRLRVEGEPVVVGDPVVLQAPGEDRYLNVAAGVDEEAADDSYLEASLGEEVQGFDINLFDGDSPAYRGAPPLRCGDCVTLLHTEEHKYVLADPAKAQCVLRTPDSRLADGGGAGEGGEPAVAWYAASKEEVSYLSMFIVEGADASRGGALRTRGGRDTYRLKSLASGLYLQCGEVPAPDSVEVSSGDAVTAGSDGVRASASTRGARQATYVMSLTPHAKAPGTLFQLHGASSNAEEFLGNGGRVFLSCVNGRGRRVWVVAGGPVAAEGEDVRDAEVTIASLAHRAKAYGSVTLLGRALKSMRDGLEVRRLQPAALEELYMIRGLLPPLQRYVREMAGGVGNPYQVRQARENVRQLQQLCHRAADPDAEDGGADLMQARSAGGGVLNPEWQSKVFQQGVGELALQVVRASLACPHVRAEKLGTLDMVYPQAAGPAAAAGAGGAAAASASAGSAARAAGVFVPMRYSELGDLVDACLQLVGLLLHNRPRYAEALQGHADFVMECARHVPSALRCVAAFYKDNPALVELPMARPRLDFFLEMLSSRGRNPDVVHVLQLFACCGGEGMVEAQRVILEHLAMHPKLKQRVLCPIRRMALSQELRETLLAHAAARDAPSASRPPPLHAYMEWDGGEASGGGKHSSGVLGRLGNPLRAVVGVGERVVDFSEVALGGDAKSAEEPTAAVVPAAASAPRADSPLRHGREVVMVGIPNSLFVEPESGDSLSIVTSTQYRAKDSALGRLLQRAADAEDVDGVTYFPLEGLLAVMQDWPEVKDTLVPYLVAQVHLLAALVYGKGRASGRAFIFECVPRVVLVETLRSEALPRSLHGALLELFANVMMDVEGVLDIREQIQNIRCVVARAGSGRGRGGGGGDGGAAASSYRMTMRAVPEELAVAKRLVVRYMETTLMSGDDSVVAEYLSVLNLTDVLVNAGAFELREYETLMRLLVRCVDPTCDDQRTYLEVQSVYDCKSRALRLMNVLMDVLLVREALLLVDHFRDGTTPRLYSQLEVLSVSDTLSRLLKRKREEYDAELGQMALDSCADADVVRDRDFADVYAAEKRRPVEELAPVANTFTALLDLANRSRSSTLQRQVICVFFRSTNFIQELHATASRVQLLTSEESCNIYADIHRISSLLETLLAKSFRRTNTVALADSALDVLEGFIASSPNRCSLSEKITMMQHANIPVRLVEVLGRLSIPLRDASRQLVFKAVTLLQTMAQNAGVREELRGVVADASPLVYLNTNYISLLRTLFVVDDEDRAQMPAQLLADVVKCLYKEHTAATAVSFLCDWLTVRRGSGHALAQRQQQVWRAVVSDQQAERRIQLRHSWCSDDGRELRERLLTSEDSYAVTGRVCTHLELCRLLYLVANGNELVKAEEMRQEVFGQNSLDAVLQVVTDALVPVYFRFAYVQLLQALVLDDAAAVASLFAHRDFADFVRLCMMDAVRYLQLLGGRSAFAEVDEELERREDAALRCPPQNDVEQEMDDARFGAAMYEDFFFGPLCACTQRVCARYRSSIAQLSNRARSRLSVVVNELVDAICDVVAFSFDGTSSRSTTQRGKQAPPKLRVPHGAQWSGEQLKSVQACLRVASSVGFRGTARWRGEFEDRVMRCLDSQVSENEGHQKRLSDAGAQVTEAALASVASGVVLKTAGRMGNSASLLSPRSDVATVAKVAYSATAGGLDSDRDMAARWRDYLRENLLDDPRTSEENQLSSAAGVLLRSGARGAVFMRILFTVMPSLSHDYLVLILTLVRQLVVLMPNNPYDDSALLPIAAQECDAAHIAVTTPVPSRQTLLARWAGDASLEVPLPLIALVCEFVGHGKADVQRAALLAACTLLMRGHRGMQESLRGFCRHSPNEQLFFVLRNHFVEFKDELRTYYHALANGSSPSEAAHYLTLMANCRLELKLLQLLCAGQYASLQTYLVAQPDNNISVNVVEALVELLSMAPKTANEVTSDLMVQLLSTIAEALQGPCIVNQDTFVAYNAADYLTLLLSEYDAFPNPDAVLTAVEVVPPTTSWYEARFGRLHVRTSTAAVLGETRRRCRTLLQTMALSTLLALIEGRDDSEFASKLVSTVDLSLLAKSMDRSAAAYVAHYGSIKRVQSRGMQHGDFKNSFAVLKRYLQDYAYGHHPTGREELEDELALAVSIYTFFRACHDMHALAATRTRRGNAAAHHGGSHDLDEFVDKKGHSIRQVLRRTRYYRHVATKLAKIEVMRDGRLERVYFRILSSAMDNLSRYRRRRLIQSAVRTSDNERIQHFFNNASEVVIEVNRYAFMRRTFVMYLIHVFGGEINVLALLVVLAINLVMVAGIRTPTSPYLDSGTSDAINEALRALGIAEICLQGVLLLQAFFGPALISLEIGWQSWKSSRASSLAKRADTDIALDRGEVLERGKKKLRPSVLEYMVYSLYYMCNEGLFLTQLFFFFVSVMGFVQHRIWYGLQLMQVAVNLPALESLFTALMQNLSALVLTLALLLFFLLFFANVSYYKFSELFNPLSSRGNGFNCYTLSQCWLVHVDTLRSSGGIGDVINWPVFYSTDGYGYWTMFYRIAYFVVVNLIGLNLFLGVIIDSLAQYRLEQAFVKTDQEKKCFICGIERNKFDVVKPGAYDVHIGEEHNMWQYLFFLYYLSEKDPNSYTGQEAYVQRQVDLCDVTFYPIGRSLVLGAMEGGDRTADGASTGATRAQAGGANTGGGVAAAGGDADGAANEEALMRAMTKVMESTLKTSLDPLRRKLEETADTLLEVKEKVLPDLGASMATVSTVAGGTNGSDSPAVLTARRATSDADPRERR